MKKLMLLVVVGLLYLSGCNSVSVWGDEEFGARLGKYIDEEKKTEVGFSGTWQDEDCEPLKIGIYTIRHLPVIEVINPIVWEGIPETVRGRPYFGLAIDRNLDEDNTDFSPIVGATIEDFIFVETRIDSDRQSALLGIKFDF